MVSNNLFPKSKVIWFTGLSGAGKSTLAQKLNKYLVSMGKKVKIFDGDEIREKFHTKLKFLPQDIRKNNYSIINYCLHNLEKYDFILVPVIAPFSETRNEARKILKDSYLEIYVMAELDDVIKRDVKGLYKKALKNEISNFVGLDPNVPYQVPINPDITINTQSSEVEESFKELKMTLKNLKII